MFSQYLCTRKPADSMSITLENEMEDIHGGEISKL